MIINGSKQWITNGNQADWICLLVNTNDNQLLHRNKSLICVRLDEPGTVLPYFRTTPPFSSGVVTADPNVLFDYSLLHSSNVFDLYFRFWKKMYSLTFK